MLKFFKSRAFRKGITIVGIAALLAISFNVTATVDIERVSDGIPTIGQAEIVITIGTEAEAAGTADYTCDGANDDVQVQAALNALPATGGKIIILAGTYSWTAATTVTRAINDVTIVGTGEATNITGDGVTALFSAGVQSNWTFRDFQTDAGGITYATSTNYTLVNVNLGGTYHAYRTDVNNITADEWAIPSGRTATFIVAAADADAQSIAQADFVCDGVADQVEINAAVAAMVSNTIGGTIQLTEGHYYLTDSIILDKPIMLSGEGVNATYLHSAHAANAAVQFDYNVLIAFGGVYDMRIQGASGGTGAGIHIVDGNSPDIELGRLWISNTGGAGIDIDGGWDHNLHNIVIEGCDGIGIDLGVSNAFITDVSSHSNFNALVMGLASQAIITGGQMSGSAQHNIIATSPYWLVIQGTKIYDAGGKIPTLNTYDGIYLTTDGANQIRGVVIADIPLMGEFGVAGSQRYGINIDRNGLDIGNSVIAIDTVNFNNNATGDISLDTTIDLANVRIRNVNGPWSVMDSSAFLNKLPIPTNAAWSTSHVNGGAGFFPFRMQVNTSAVANSRGMGYVEAGGFMQTGVYYTWDWDEALRISFNLVRFQPDAQVVGRVQLKEANTQGALGALGVGIRVDEYALVGESYGGALGTTALGVTMTSLQAYNIDIILIPGADRHIYWAVRGIISGIETTVNNVPSGQSANVEYFLVSIINGAGGGTDCSMYVFHPWIYQVR